MGPWTSYLNKRDNYHLLSACLWQTLGIAHGFYLLPHLCSKGAGPDHTQAWIIKRGRAEIPQAWETKVIPKELRTRAAAQMG